MNSIENYSHPKAPTKASQTRRRALAAIAVISLSVSAACSNDSKQTVNPRPATSQAPGTETVATLPSTTTTEKVASSQVYFENNQRNNQIETKVFRAAEVIQTASVLGAIGYLDFYNTQTREWQSKSPTTTGWGWFQHNPQYGGSKNQLSFYAFRNSDGTMASDKGILGLRVQADDKPMIAIESREIRHINDPSKPQQTGWDVTISDGIRLLDAASAKSDTEVVVIDTLAQNEIDAVTDNLARQLPQQPVRVETPQR